jgi:hypothetical protein
VNVQQATGEPQGWNCYSYVRNHAMNALDPNGRQEAAPEMGMPAAGGPSGGSSGPVSSGGSGKSTGSCCPSGSSNSGNASSPGSGPGGLGVNTGPWGAIIGTSGAYVPGTVDYPQPGEVQPAPVVLQNDDKPCAGDTCFQKALDDIQSQLIPYNPFLWNSNTVVRELLSRCGFNSAEPKNWVPAWSNKFP